MAHARRRGWWAVAGMAALAVLASGDAGRGAPPDEGVDTALIVSVDVSNSVDERRYHLQLEGIARALEDPAVMKAILGGPKGSIAFMMVTWADRPMMKVPWIRIASAEDARMAAAKVRKLPHHGGEFTCLSRMLRHVADKIVTQVPVKATRVVLDVSGDGSDNCNPEEPVTAVRDELAASRVTVNGLPILEGREAQTLEAWYRDNVVGGPGGFLLPAEGYEDFGRAIRQKFVVEISQRVSPADRADTAPISRAKPSPG